MFYDFYEARALIALTVCGGVMAKRVWVEGSGEREAGRIAAIILLDDFR